MGGAGLRRTHEAGTWAFSSLSEWYQVKARGEELEGAGGTLRGVSWQEGPSSSSCSRVTQVYLTPAASAG